VSRITRGRHVVLPVEPGGDRVDDRAFDPDEVLELAGDRIATQQLAAAILKAPIAVLQGQVQRRPPGDGDAERPAAGRGGQRDGEDEPALADLGRADQQHRPLRDHARDGVGQRRKVLGVQPSAVAEPGK
jgi:hypothetical protein